MPSTTTPSRLQPATDLSIAPFLRAGDLQTVALYWVGVNAWPPYFSDREWLLRVLDHLAESLGKEQKLQPLQFLQASVGARTLRSLFLQNARVMMPMLGSMVRPGRVPAQMPDEATIEKAKSEKTPLAVDAIVEDQAYWLVGGKAVEQRATFFGYGGMSLLFAPPEPGAAVPVPSFPAHVLAHPGMKDFDPGRVQEHVRVAEHLRGSFGQRSKDLYGEAFRTHSQYDGILFTLPVWSSANFLAASKPELDALFSLCEVYVQESPVDRGILIASPNNLDEFLSAAVAAASAARATEPAAAGQARA